MKLSRSPLRTRSTSPTSTRVRTSDRNRVAASQRSDGGGAGLLFHLQIGLDEALQITVKDAIDIAYFHARTYVRSESSRSIAKVRRRRCRFAFSFADRP